MSNLKALCGLASMSPTDMLKTADFLSSVSKVLIMIAAVGAFILVIAFLRMRRKNRAPKGPNLSRTVFTEGCFGIIYNATEEHPEARAAVFDSKGQELCSLIQADGQTFRGFVEENGVLYLYTTETNNGDERTVKWMFDAATNDFAECD